MSSSAVVPGILVGRYSVQGAIAHNGQPYPLARQPWQFVQVLSGYHECPPQEFLLAFKTQRLVACNTPTLIKGNAEAPHWKTAALAHEAFGYSDFVAVYDHARKTFVVILSRVGNYYPVGAEIPHNDGLPICHLAAAIT